ncbi:putative RNA methyltransferase [Scheffersomyces xylosifermentans]|uniref:putative RNA methyltransferase n=1 Tax=Scheffersomyces xylosifermentans TaxID=1304137 RepID=UPI00315CF33A
MAKRKSEEVSSENPTKKPVKETPKVQVSVCIPSSIIGPKNAHNLEQATAIAYQIAKASTIYNVVEIIILDTPDEEELAKQDKKVVEMGGNKGGKKLKFNFSDEDIVQTKVADEVKEPEVPSSGAKDSYLLAGLLQFFITPPYLVKTIFSPVINPNPINKDILKKFKYAYKLPKITTLPFMSNNKVYRDFKEGITIPKETPKVVSKKDKSKKVKAEKKISVTKYVNIGEAEPLELNIKREIPVNSRVTVDLKNKSIVSPLQAYGVMGNKSSFGYYIRFCKKFSSIFTESSVPDGYTSSVYVHSDDYFNSNDKIEDVTKIKVLDSVPKSDATTNVLLVVGNYKDYETSFKRDNLEGVDSVGQMFDGQLAIPDGARTEDALLIALTKVYS